MGGGGGGGGGGRGMRQVLTTGTRGWKIGIRPSNGKKAGS